MNHWNNPQGQPAHPQTPKIEPLQMDLSLPNPAPAARSSPPMAGQAGAPGTGDPALNAWVQAISNLRAQLPPGEQEARALLDAALRDIYVPEVTLAFGGHFNAGKSTLINGLLGRDILPVDDVVETGALCIVRPGTSDRAWLHHKAGSRELPCTSADIRGAISLLTAEGARRADLEGVDHLEVMLANVPMPVGARWIDTPGTDDKLEMTACAMRAARQSDILLWVLNAQQILSEGEMEFVAQCVEERGAASVIFVLNAFLSNDTPEQWQAFLDTRAERLTQKVRDYAERMGYTPQIPPCVLPTSGRALCGARGRHSLGVQTDFGRTGLTTLLSFLHHSENTRVRRSRLHAVGRKLLTRCALLERRLAEAQAEQERMRQQERERQERRLRRGEYERKVQEMVYAQADGCAMQMYACGEQLAAQVTPETLRRDDWYQAQMDAALQAALAHWLRAVSQSAAGLLTACGLAAPTPEQSAQLHRSLALPPSLILAARNLPPTVETADVTALQADIRAAAKRAVQMFGIQVNPFAQLLQYFGMDAAQSQWMAAPEKPPAPSAAAQGLPASQRALMQALRPLGEQAIQLARRPL